MIVVVTCSSTGLTFSVAAASPVTVITVPNGTCTGPRWQNWATWRSGRNCCRLSRHSPPAMPASGRERFYFRFWTIVSWVSLIFFITLESVDMNFERRSIAI